VNFLQKIIDAINGLLILIFDKMYGLIPGFVFAFTKFLRHLPSDLKHKYQNDLSPKIRIWRLKFIGYTHHYTDQIKVKTKDFISYINSDEFKNINKKELLLSPFRFAIHSPKKAFATFLAIGVFCYGIGIVYTNTGIIVNGTKSLRKPASAEEAEIDTTIKLEKIKFEAKVGEGHGGEEKESEIVLTITIDASSDKEKKYLESIHEEIADALEEVEIKAKQMPLNKDDAKLVEDMMLKTLNELLKEQAHLGAIKTLRLEQVMEGRPFYFLQTEKIYALKDVNIQIFLEDTKRNRQVYFDFSMLATNRYIVMFLTEHEIELRDFLTTNVEPVLPRLPLEEEGRGIIKDKIRDEVNEFLKIYKVEGKVQEVYIDSLISS
jgi:hypothetical protein